MLRNIAHLWVRSIHNVQILKIIDLKPTIKYRYSAWSSRTPTAIVNEDELFDDTETTVTKTHKTYKTHRHRSKATEKKKDEKSKKETVNKGYIALKEDDKIISSLMLKIKTRKLREKNNLMLLEGFRLIKDAIEVNIIPKIIFFNKLSDILPLSLPKEVKLYKIPYRTIQLWSNLTTSPGILGIFDIPEIKDKNPIIDAIPLTIICDNIREPGNLGSIIRAAAAVGCERLLLMKGCVDLWDPKVVRSAVGAHFRLPITTCLSWDEIPTLINEESKIFLADNNITYESEFENYTVNQISNTNVPIGSKDSIKSENSIRAENSIESKNSVESEDKDKDYSDNNIDYNNDDEKIDQLLDQNKSKKSTTNTRSLVKKIISQLPVVPYHTLDFTQRETVLIIGGETEGISLESCKLLKEKNCIRINIPLTNNIDSLNVGVAVGVVTFEIKRQFMSRNINIE